MLVFACETSCDETSLCLMEDNKIVNHVIFSQEIHKKHGGIVPELASRSHLKILQNFTLELFSQKDFDAKTIDLFTATCGPGLIGSLLVGSTFAKSLSLGFNKPFVPMNHLEGHVLSTSFNNDVKFPHLVLLLTGGHTQVYIMNNQKEIQLLGVSVDDSIGEVFDKTARLVGLSYPGGPEIERNAQKGDENFFNLPKPLINEKNFNFSFSGIKTHINLLTKKNKIDTNFKYNLCASFQKTISEILITKINNGLKFLNTNIKSISVVGGVSNNNYIRAKIEQFAADKKIDIYYPIKEMMSDNAAMIAWACLKNYDKNKADLYFRPKPRMEINNIL